MKRILMSWGVLALCVATASVAMADPLCSAGGGWQLLNATVTNGTVYSGNGLFGGSNGCTIGGLDFNNWQISPNTGYSNGGANLNFTVNSSSGNLALATNMSVGDDIQVEFSVSGVPGPSSDLLSVGGGGGVNEVICSTQMVIGSGGGAGSCAAASGTTLGSGAVNGVNSSTTIFISPLGTEWVFKDISTASEVSQLFSTASVPEPMTLSLTGIGLLGLGLFGRRLRK